MIAVTFAYNAFLSDIGLSQPHILQISAPLSPHSRNISWTAEATQQPPVWFLFVALSCFVFLHSTFEPWKSYVCACLFAYWLFPPLFLLPVLSTVSRIVNDSEEVVKNRIKQWVSWNMEGEEWLFSERGWSSKGLLKKTSVWIGPGGRTQETVAVTKGQNN